VSNNRLLTLCQEYIATVDAMRSGQYTVDELRTLDSERQLLHDELCRLTGYSRRADMYRAARLILRDGGIDA
jgi:hypothetical protein